MEEMTLREIQMAEFGILKFLKTLNEKLGLRYQLAYGTLLGAVRHHGFIPWDDDVDVIMPRPDFEKLMEFCRKNPAEIAPFKLAHYTTDKHFPYSIARLCDPRYEVVYEEYKEHGFGLFVDIYPYDGAGNSVGEAQTIIDGNKNLISVISSAANLRFVPSPNGRLRSVIKRVIWWYTELFGISGVIRRVDKKSMRHSFEKDALSYCTVWCTNAPYACRRTDFDETARLEFEGELFTVPAAYDRVLRQIYKDYMQLPPEADRVGHHYYKAYPKA